MHLCFCCFPVSCICNTRMLFQMSTNKAITLFTLLLSPPGCCQMGRNSSEDDQPWAGGSSGWSVWKACPGKSWSDDLETFRKLSIELWNFPWKPRGAVQRDAGQPGRSLPRGGTSPSPPDPLISRWKSPKLCETNLYFRRKRKTNLYRGEMARS